MADVGKSGYYKWLKLTNQPEKDRADYLKIKAVFDKSRGKYGWRSIKMRLPEMNHKKIQRIMRKYDLVAKVRRKNPYRAIMKKSMEHRTFPNKLQRESLTKRYHSRYFVLTLPTFHSKTDLYTFQSSRILQVVKLWHGIFLCILR
jgi:hypothetical protein